jgi:hypothetical protein
MSVCRCVRRGLRSIYFILLLLVGLFFAFADAGLLVDCVLGS